MKSTWAIDSEDWIWVNATRTDRTITPEDEERGLRQEIHARSAVAVRDAIDEQDRLEESQP